MIAWQPPTWYLIFWGACLVLGLGTQGLIIWLLWRLLKVMHP